MAVEIIEFYFINFQNISKNAFFINNFNTSELPYLRLYQRMWLHTMCSRYMCTLPKKKLT